jgi:hypothetical protein
LGFEEFCGGAEDGFVKAAFEWMVAQEFDGQPGRSDEGPENP